MTTNIITIKDLHAVIDGKEVLKGINLTINAGEIHAIMGPNGSGKSTLSHVLAGRDGYEVTQGSIIFQGKDLTELATDERARAGLFLAFQYPVEIPGVSSMNFLRSAVNAVRSARGQDALDSFDFLKEVKTKQTLLKMDAKLLKRAVNTGFSGGEKKRYDILQMAMLEPIFAILDETDSGLDIDALRIVAEGVNSMKSNDRAMLLITHYQRLLNYIVPDYVHILADGVIKFSGGKELALRLEEEGYRAFGINDDEAA